MERKRLGPVNTKSASFPEGTRGWFDQIAFPGPEALSWSTNPAPKPESCSDFYSKLGAA